ncbi:hypothetical protein [Streptomyces virginiae]|uniref:hypothetical protein n=1 Tax=Streptomyces virginiae TaxID=1961 RepID=UPI003247165B
MNSPTTDPARPDTMTALSRITAGTPTVPRKTLSTTDKLRLAADYEWRHLRGLRSTWIVLSVAAVLAIGNGLSLLLVADANTAPTPAAVADNLQWAPTATQLPLLALLLIAIGTGSVSADLTRGTAPTTWLTAASRRTAFVAKVCVASLLVTATAVATALIAGVVGALALVLGGMPQPAWGESLPALLRFVLVMACWPVVAASVAALVRNRTASVLVLVLWPLIIERAAGVLVGRLLGADSLAGVLPFAAARAAMSGAPDTGDGADAALERTLLGSGLDPWTGVVVHAVFAIAIGCAGAWAYSRRDAA